jgi:hypothetical protein
MRAGDKEPGAFSLPIHRARHRSLKLAASHAAIFGIFYVHWNRAHHRASAIVEPSGAIKWWSRFDFLQAFSRRNFMTITTGHIPAIVALIAGILILIMPRLLNLVVAIYLICIGLIGLGLLKWLHL